MLVGHNPGMEELLVQLVGKAIPHGKLMKLLPTATVACLKVGRSWGKVSAETTTLEFIRRGKQVRIS
jgi:phosphohistidine phosphatase SixA